jgi:hypothetical protein
LAGRKEHERALRRSRVYLARGTAEGISEEWLESARHWLDSYGIDTFDVHSNGRAMFQWYRPSPTTTLAKEHILLLSFEKSVEAVPNPQSYGSEVNAVIYYAQGQLDDLMPLIVTSQMLRLTGATIQSLREKVFRRMESSHRWIIRAVGLPTRLHGRMLLESMQFARLRTEFASAQQTIERKARSWRDMMYVPKHPDREHNLVDDAIKALTFQFETIDKHLSVARDAFSEYFSVQNTWIMFWLTVVVTVLTLVQVYTNKEIMDWLKAVLHADDVLKVITGILDEVKQAVRKVLP